jgi:hypothetical protein
MKPDRRILLTIVIFSFGILGALINITHEGLWNDEACTALLTRFSFVDLLANLQLDAHPPLYFIGVKAFTILFGNSLIAMRLFSVLGLIALALLGLGPIKRHFGNNNGLIFSFLCFFLPISVSFAQEARMYTWTCFFITGMVLYGYSAIKSNKKKDWLIYAVFSLGSIYVHIFGLIIFLVFSCIIAGCMYFRQKASAKYFFICTGIILALYIPWLHVTIDQATRASQSPWYVKTSIPQIAASLLILFSDRFLIINFIPSFLLTFLISYYLLFMGVRRAWIESKDSLPALMFATILTTFIIVIAASLLIAPILMPRYAFTVFGMALIICIIGGQSIKNTKLRMIITILLIILFVPQRIHMHANRINGPLPEVQAYLKSKVDSIQIFLHSNEHTFTTFAWYFPQNMHYLYEPNSKELVRQFTKNGFRIKDLTSVIRNKNDVWVVNKIETHISKYVSGQPLQIKDLTDSLGFMQTAESDTFKTIPKWYPGRKYSQFEMNPNWFQIKMVKFEKTEFIKGKRQDTPR